MYIPCSTNHFYSGFRSISTCIYIYLFKTLACKDIQIIHIHRQSLVHYIFTSGAQRNEWKDIDKFYHEWKIRRCSISTHKSTYFFRKQHLFSYTHLCMVFDTSFTYQVLLCTMLQYVTEKCRSQSILKDEVLITVGCPIFPSILIAKYLFTLDFQGHRSKVNVTGSNFYRVTSL